MSGEDIDFVRAIVRSALWNINYHENALPAAYADLAFAKELMGRFGLDEGAKRGEYDNDDDVICDTIEQFVCSIFDSKASSVEYHEDGLKKAHNELGLVKIFLARGRYTEIDIDEVLADVRK